MNGTAIFEDEYRPGGMICSVQFGAFAAVWEASNNPDDGGGRCGGRRDITDPRCADGAGPETECPAWDLRRRFGIGRRRLYRRRWLKLRGAGSAATTPHWIFRAIL